MCERVTLGDSARERRERSKAEKSDALSLFAFDGSLFFVCRLKCCSLRVELTFFFFRFFPSKRAMTKTPHNEMASSPLDHLGRALAGALSDLAAVGDEARRRVDGARDAVAGAIANDGRSNRRRGGDAAASSSCIAAPAARRGCKFPFFRSFQWRDGGHMDRF